MEGKGEEILEEAPQSTGWNLHTGRYRKRPVVIDAVPVTLHNVAVVAAWCGGVAISPEATEYMVGNKIMFIDTLEGRMYADADDWIIRGVQGEFYPCKPDIFAATYEAVDQ